ncbi:MAG TPA: hypothetical protein VGL88_06360 [Pseudonocardiaceae bacterium]
MGPAGANDQRGEVLDDAPDPPPTPDPSHGSILLVRDHVAGRRHIRMRDAWPTHAAVHELGDELHP